MRIIGGKYRGFKLVSPKTTKTRATSDLAKEALFNILNDKIDGARFLDLFGGAGAIGLEAVSRGAREVVIVERSETALIKKNIEKLKLDATGIVRLVKADALGFCERSCDEKQKFDIVFADPPWAEEYEEKIVTVAADLIADDGLFVLEAFHKAAPPDGPDSVMLKESRRYGDTAFHFYTRKKAT